VSAWSSNLAPLSSAQPRLSNIFESFGDIGAGRHRRQATPPWQIRVSGLTWCDKRLFSRI
jgi:hypothetical protein